MISQVSNTNFDFQFLLLLNTSLFISTDYGPGGSHVVEVLVKGKGLADNAQQLNFTYVISATSVSPASGSTAGGQVITISGSGFGNKKENATVSLDGSPCEILTINMSQITCRTSVHSVGRVSVDISIDDSSDTVTDAFEYDSSLTIQVTSVSPLQGRVSGGELITVSGSGFMNTTTVQVGNENCVIQSRTGVEITCLVPRNPAGKFPIRLVTPGKGFAQIPDEYSTYEYIFEVHSIFPLIGSVAGGTHVTITGRGFGLNASRAVVTVQGRPCRVTSCNDTHVTCETEDIFQTVEVDNSGVHPGWFNVTCIWFAGQFTLVFFFISVVPYGCFLPRFLRREKPHDIILNRGNIYSCLFLAEFGLGYEWSPKHVICHQGDTVKVRSKAKH